MGAFGGKVINLFATHAYGPNWQSMSMLQPSDGNSATEFIDV
jgi:hypothetical protein